MESVMGRNLRVGQLVSDLASSLRGWHFLWFPVLAMFNQARRVALWMSARILTPLVVGCLKTLPRGKIRPSPSSATLLTRTFVPVEPHT